MQNRSEINQLIRRHKFRDFCFSVLGLLALLIGLMTLLALLIDLGMQGSAKLSLSFFTEYASSFANRPSGILPAWIGTLLVMFVTALAAIPLGVAAGVYLEEYAKKNWLTSLIEINIANLAGVPSIVYGLLALGFFVYQFQLGGSILTAGLTLALLILPIVIITTRESIRAVPQNIREAAYALGATQWETVRHHVIPYSSGGILTGIIIGLSRAIGETAPLITVGAVVFINFLPQPPFIVGEGFPYLHLIEPGWQEKWHAWLQTPFVFTAGDGVAIQSASLFGWLKSEFTVLPIQMYHWVDRTEKSFHQYAASAGLVLIGMTLFFNSIAIYIRYRYRKKIKW